MFMEKSVIPEEKVEELFCYEDAGAGMDQWLEV